MKDKILIVKAGGSLIDCEAKWQHFLKEFAAIKKPKILVHGGGKSASALSKKMGLTPRIIHGRRVTTLEDLPLVIMTFAGLINKKTVAALQSYGCNALGLTGADANCIRSSKRPTTPIDYGYVGDIVSIDTSVLLQWLNLGITPVFCALTHDGHGQILNTNADTIAAQLAIALHDLFETELLYCLEKPGVLLDSEDSDSLIKTLDYYQYEKLKHNHQIHSGMLPKLTNCFTALQKDVKKVTIGDTSLLREGSTTGTRIILKKD